MNRVIKFRAWDKKAKVMVLLDEMWLCVEYSSLAFSSSQDEYQGICAWPAEAYNSEKEDQIFMQFTGLLDRNGKEIYEGDVITSPSVGNLKQGSVEWGTCGFVVREQGVHGSKDGTWTEVLSSWAYPLDGQGALRGEIIGNIYENLELLTK